MGASSLPYHGHSFSSSSLCSRLAGQCKEEWEGLYVVMDARICLAMVLGVDLPLAR